jgi:hypothetical protein
VDLSPGRWVAAALLAAAVVAGCGGDEEGDETSTTAAAEVKPAPCDERSAKQATLTTGFADRIDVTAAVQASLLGLEAETGAGVSQGRFWDEVSGHRVAILECADLTGDDVDEMVLAPSAGAGGNIFNWAVFTPDAEGEWQLAFSREAHQIASLKLRDDTIVERVPVYAEGEPLCCPSGFETSEIAHRDGEFVVASSTAEPSQREIAFAEDGTPLTLGELDLRTADPADARAQFGTPTSVFSPDANICDIEWSGLGLTITFANLGGADPCGREGAIGSFALLGSVAEQAGWQTDEGATLGMGPSELREIYPDAAGGRDMLTLISRPSPFGDGGTTPSLDAYLGDGRALAYRVFVGAAGE